MCTAKTEARVKQKRRANDSWVSYNRVLIGNSPSKKTVGRNPNFDTDETKLLIQLWGDPKVQRTLITTHKKHIVISQLAARMEEYGYRRSPEEITTRIKNLKCFYNRLKKEIDSGQASDTEPTWRHFAEMDAIMTRPIFSVRPNEVPQPSRKYQLEQEREEREERRKQNLDEGGDVSDSEENNEDDIESRSKTSAQDIDDGIIPDVEVDMDINDETFAAITAAEAAAIDSIDKRNISSGDIESELEADNDDGEEENALQIKEEDTESEKSLENFNVTKRHNSLDACEMKCDFENEEFTSTKPTTNVGSSSKTNAALIIPKEEPIDVDAEYAANSSDKNMKSNVGEFMPTLAEMLKMTQPNVAGSTLSVSVANVVTSSNINTTVSSAATTVASVAASPRPPSTTAPTGKISIVPASFLLPPPANAAMAAVSPPTVAQPPQPQLQLLSNVLGNAPAQIQATRIMSKTPAGIVATGPGGVKVLLVNADQADGNVNSSSSNSNLAQSLHLQQAVVTPHQQQFHQIINSQQQQPQQQKQQQKPQQQQHNNNKQQEIQKQNEENQKQRKKPKVLRPQTEQQNYGKTNGDAGCNALPSGATRQLLRQLHDVLEENNDIQRKRLRLESQRLESERSAIDVERQRLAIERERLDFERSTFQRLLDMLPSLLSQSQTQQQQQQQQMPPPTHAALVTQSAVAAPTAMLISPSQLVFSSAGATGGATFATTIPATAVSSAAAVFAANKFAANNLTATAAAAVTASSAQSNDIQLLKPKLEIE